MVFWFMKIVTKAYLLIAVLIGVAVFNLLLLYQDDKSDVSQSYSIIRAGDVKVKAELISSLATSIASGNVADVDNFENQIKDIESTLEIIKNGGVIKEQTLEKIPVTLLSDFNKVESAWSVYKDSALLTNYFCGLCQFFCNLFVYIVTSI